MSCADGAPEGPSLAEGPSGGGPLAGEHKPQDIPVLHQVRAALSFARSLFVQSEGWSALIAQYPESGTARLPWISAFGGIRRDAQSEEKIGSASSRTYSAVIAAEVYVPMNRTNTRCIFAFRSLFSSGPPRSAAAPPRENRSFFSEKTSHVSADASWSALAEG